MFVLFANLNVTHDRFKYIDYILLRITTVVVVVVEVEVEVEVVVVIVVVLVVELVLKR